MPSRDKNGFSSPVRYLSTFVPVSVLLFILLSFSSTAGAQQLLKARVPIENNTKSLLWKIEGNGLEKPSYLFGTIHLIPRDKFLFNNAMNQAFSSCEKVVFEIDMNVMNDFTQMFGLLSKIRMPDGITLQDLLSPEDYQLFQDKFGEQGLPTMFLESIKPMFLSAMGGDITGSQGEMISYEVELSDKARSLGKSIGGLETIDEQLSVIDSIPLKEQAQMLVDELKKTDDDQSYDIMVRHYLDQDIEYLNSFINQSAGQQDTKMMNSLLRDRNIRWIPAMKKLMEEQPTFFAVGAGHLGGKDGVIQLLKNEGYNVKAITEL